MKIISSNVNKQEYSGFNTKVPPEAGQGLRLNTRTIYLPLINAPPTDPSFMITGLKEVIRLTDQTCQRYNVITFNQQLLKILVDIKWASHLKYLNVVLRHGGVHLMISFIGCVGNLMVNSGLDENQIAAFGGV